MNFDPEKQIKYIDFVFLDFETTGFYPEKDKIIEIGCIRARNRQIIGTFSELVDPEMEVPEETTKITGINSDMVNGRGNIESKLDNLLEFIRDSVLVIHNASFDIPFLRVAIKRTNGADAADIENKIVDTYSLAKDTFPKMGKYALQFLVDKLGLPKSPAHRALGDCYSCMHLFNRCCDEKSFMGDLILKDVLF